MASKAEILAEWEGISSRELAVICRDKIGKEDAEETPSGAFYYRGGREEFEIGVEYCRSADPLDRCTGAFLLEHLGSEGNGCPFAAESLPVIIPLLDDADERVIQAGVWALGRLAEVSAVREVLRFDEHPNEDIRYSVTFALSMMTEGGPEVTKSLLKLAKDPDRDIRDWATFALGSQSEEDSPEIREVLCEALEDADGEIRGEAYRGLANRKDPRMVDGVLKAFEGYDPQAGSLIDWWEEFDPQANVIEAITNFPDPRLAPVLEKLLASVGEDITAEIREKVEAALLECRK